MNRKRTQTVKANSPGLLKKPFTIPSNVMSIPNAHQALQGSWASGPGPNSGYASWQKADRKINEVKNFGSGYIWQKG